MCPSTRSSNADQQLQDEIYPVENPELFDPATLPEEWSDQPEFVAEILKCFIKETETDLAAIDSAWNGNETARVSKIAHRVKGAASAINAELIRRAAADLESLAHKSPLPGTQESIAKLRREFERFAAYVAELHLR